MRASGGVISSTLRTHISAAVLVINSDARRVSFFSELLGDDGVKVHWTTGFDNPVEIVAQGLPDLIIIEDAGSGLCQDPDEADSLELCKRLKCDLATDEIPILMLTRHGDDGGWGDSAIPAGVDDFLEAHAQPAVLRQRIECLLRTRKRARAAETRYGSLVEFLPALVYVAEPYPPYSPIYISPSFASLGYPLEEWYRKPDLWISVL